jgi:2-polyprenyl-3-methyl-5-hydroxy-6-metoxy-1,4-benzoquinol methylase
MSLSEQGSAKVTWDLGDVTDDGERVTHLYPNDCYFAHLSLYRFALPLCRGGDVLDAGSGTGYGAAYLAENGARSVVGIDLSAKAIAFSRYHFRQSNLQYKMMDLEQLRGLMAEGFDLIFSSNVLEHLVDVPRFLRAAHRLLKADGVAVFVMPPITSPELRAADLQNPYHLNSWSPRQWQHVISQYFADVRPYTHNCSSVGYPLDFANTPQQARIDERDFVFEPVKIDGLAYSLSALFVARHPRAEGDLPVPGAPIAFVDDSFSRPPLPRPGRRPAWRRIPSTMLKILRQYGLRRLARETIQYLSRLSWLLRNR